jgi:phosphoribosyl 1,2-cyclic phosphodiesterase
MLLRFWGVRGSLPSPPLFSEIKEKIREALLLAFDKGLYSDRESLSEFADSLPPLFSGFVGGNTPCVEISHGERTLIFDAGSGIKNLGAYMTPRSDEDVYEALRNSDVKFDTLKEIKKPGREVDLFLTHTHWDHIQGFPFFAPIYDKDTRLNIYSASPRAVEDNLRIQQSSPLLFPIHFDELPAHISFLPVGKEGLELEPFKVDSMRLPHPGGSTAYRIKAFGKIVVFATDYELQDDSHETLKIKEELKDFIQKADVFISDSQYTYLESHSKEGWGHSNALNVVDMAQMSGVKNLYLFHHDPGYPDQKLYAMLEKATSYNKLLFPKGEMRIHLATEGLTVELASQAKAPPKRSSTPKKASQSKKEKT